MRRTSLGVLCGIAVLSGAACQKANPTRPSALTIEVGSMRTTLTSSDLDRHSEQRTVVVSDCPVYPKLSLEFRAVPMNALLSPEEIPSGMHVLFECADGFATSILASRVLSNRPGGSRAFLAVEDPESPWPPVPGKPDVRPGPFFLVWTDASADHVLSEEWPYQIRSIRVVPPPGASYPALSPEPGIASDDPIRRGFGTYTGLCLPCHPLNGEGPAAVGPDLNLPLSPTEYFQDGILRRYVRDPRSVRRWPGQKMPGFSTKDLSDEDLLALEQYLRHMASRRSPRDGEPARRTP